MNWQTNWRTHWRTSHTNELVNALAEAGHEVIYQSTKQKHYKKALKQSADLVLAAGGDGTVGKVARELIDTGVPLAVLPLGTANNLARSLGFIAAPEKIIAGLNHGEKRTFDPWTGQRREITIQGDDGWGT